MAESVTYTYDDGTHHCTVVLEFDQDYHGLTGNDLIKAILNASLQQLSRAGFSMSKDDSEIDAWAAQVKTDRPTGTSSSSSGP